MSADHALAGALWLRPGHPPPHNLRSTRPDVVARLVQGRPARELPALLAHLHALCGHAHRLCADLAVQAAMGRSVLPSAAQAQQLRMHTLREHLVRIALEWPRLAGGGPDAAAADRCRGAAAAPLLPLPGCPLLAADPSPADVAAWLQQHLYGMPLTDWLAAWRADPAVALRTWSLATSTPVATLLRAAPVHAGRAAHPVPALQVHAHVADLRDFAAALARDPALHRHPRWRGGNAETGPWTRLADQATPRTVTPVLRVAARLADMARLALPGGEGWLQCGALPLAPGAALAWVEMSRGLLMHHVVLQGEGDDARVAGCRVIAPTEWNFDAEGAVARRLGVLPPDTGLDDPRLQWLLAAYDACVPTVIEDQPAATALECGHA